MKASRTARTDHTNLKLKRWWDVQQERKGKTMSKDLTETLARMWMQCDPNRGGSDPDELMPMKIAEGGTDMPTVERDNPLGGEPRWKWFVPRAEASIRFLQANGFKIVRA